MYVCRDPLVTTNLSASNHTWIDSVSLEGCHRRFRNVGCDRTHRDRCCEPDLGRARWDVVSPRRTFTGTSAYCSIAAVAMSSGAYHAKDSFSSFFFFLSEIRSAKSIKFPTKDRVIVLSGNLRGSKRRAILLTPKPPSQVFHDIPFKRAVGDEIGN